MKAWLRNTMRDNPGALALGVCVVVTLLATLGAAVALELVWGVQSAVPGNPTLTVTVEEVAAGDAARDPRDSSAPAAAGGKGKRWFYRESETLGYAHRPRSQATVLKQDGARLIYRAIYTTDDFGRRVMPAPADEATGAAILMLGGSFTFGIGVNDQETMPWKLAEALPGRAVHNYGIEGYGPQQTFEIMQRDLSAEVKEREAVAVYTLIDHHVDRAAGTPMLAVWNAASFPWYELDEESGRPVRRGRFGDRENSPEATSGSSIVNRWRAWRHRVTKEDARLAALLLDGAREGFERQFESKGFYVVVYPRQESELLDMMIPILEAGGAKVLDYRDLLPEGHELGKWFIPGDSHPTAALHALVATRLAEDIVAGSLGEGR